MASTKSTFINLKEAKLQNQCRYDVVVFGLAPNAANLKEQGADPYQC